MNDTQHPTPEQLLKFAHGDLREPEFSRVEAHVAECDACCQWMAGQPENTLLALAREVATIGVRGGRAPTLVAEETPAALVEHPRYHVRQRIGVGGMGVVYLAEHRLMQRPVALKIIHPWLLAKPEAVERFEREVRLAARLSHPNIVVSYDADHAGDAHFLVMEYVAGESLEARIKRTGPATVQEACEWIRQAALGLAHAHEQGMVHRDIKPHNLMIASDGQVKILDFGLTRLVAEPAATSAANERGGSDQTHAGTILGTPDYIAPEQIADSRRADIRSDIYSLGGTLYFALAGEPPFPKGSLFDKLHAHEHAPLPRLSKLRSDVSPELVAMLDRMTAKRPEERFQTPGEVAAALAALLSPEHSHPPLAPPLPPSSAAIRKRPVTIAPTHWMAGIALGMMVLLGGLGALNFFGGDDEPGKRNQAAADTKRSPRLLVVMPSKGLWFPDYQELVNADKESPVALTFASPVARPSEVLYTSIPGVAVPDVQVGPDLKASDYDGVIFIGYDTSEYAPQGIAGSEADRLINEFQMQKKVLASLCTGQRVLAQHKALRGKNVATCQVVNPDEIRFGGGKLLAEKVVRDGLVVTGSHADYAPDLLAEIEKILSP